MMKDFDHAEWVGRADIVLDRPVDRSEGGMPIGNGRTGTLVWTTPTAIRMQINRVDVFGCNRQTNSFHFHEDYCGGCGFVDIDLGDADVFTDDTTHQHLGLYDALLTLRGKGVEASVLAWHERDVIAVQIRDDRETPEPIRINLCMLREPVKLTYSHRAESTFGREGNRITLGQTFTEGDYCCASSVAVGTLGRPCGIKQVNERELTLTLPAGGEPVTVLIASAGTFDRDADIEAAALADLDAAADAGWDGLLAGNQTWWHDFWSKSFIRLRSDNGEAEFVEKHYTMFLYIMGATSRGQFAPKFNGMLWNTGGDLRMWGTQFWWNNMCLTYRALPAANHIELTDPLFDLYSGMADAAAAAARDVWKSEGLYIPETCWFDGPEELPPELVDEASDLFLFRKPWAERSDAFFRQAETKNEFSCWWNWSDRRGPCTNGRWNQTFHEGAPSAYITHIFGSMARLAYQYWLRYTYTGDAAWLKAHAYPMLKGIAEFFRNFPNLSKGPDGLYHIRKVNHSEGTRGATDTMGCLVGMRGVLPAAIQAAEILGVDGDLREAWRELLDNLAPLPTSDHPDAIRPSEPGEPPVWVDALKPVDRGGGGVLLDPVAHCDVCTLETQESDTELYEIAEDTYARIYPDGVDENTVVSVMSKRAFEAARLGRGDDVRHMLLSQLRILSTEGDFEAFEQTQAPGALDNRMTLREGEQALSAEQLGNAASGLQEALCQSIPPAPGGEPVIRVFPAWAEGWDAEFQLLCRGGFLVGSAIEGGRIGSVEIISQLGGECRVRNPWGEGAVRASCSDGRTLDLGGSLLRLETQAGETWELLPG